MLWNLYVSWFKMGLFTFGGGYAMLPMIQKEVIEKHHWATEDEIMDYYAIGQCTPGIIAVNTATFVGYKLKGIIGGIVADHHYRHCPADFQLLFSGCGTACPGWY